MKNYLLYFLFLLPTTIFGQQEIVLNVNQPPEFGFSISKTDTTILIGTSVILGSDLFVFGGLGDYQFLWTPDSTLNNSALQNPVAIPLDTTTYYLTVTDEFGCSFTLSYTVKTRGPLVGAELIDGAGKLEALLFPNPNSGSFKVQITGEPANEIEIVVFDSSGRIFTNKKIKNFTGNHTESFLLNLVSGSYTLKIIADNETISRQFIIQ